MKTDETRFTPGPWSAEIHELSGGYSGIVYDQNGYRLGTDHLTPADANLIAAAPELYFALVDLVKFSHPVFSREDGVLVAAAKKARVAISKARGEPLNITDDAPTHRRTDAP